MKVAITSPKIEMLYNNGVRFNTILWYDFFVNCGFDVSFVTNEDINPEDPVHKNYKFLNYMNLWNIKDKKSSLKYDYKDLYPELFDFDVVFNGVGLQQNSNPRWTLLHARSSSMSFWRRSARGRPMRRIW